MVLNPLSSAMLGSFESHSPIKNLFFSGCEVGAVGVMGAMGGGLACAMAMEPIGAGKLMASIS